MTQFDPRNFCGEQHTWITGKVVRCQLPAEHDGFHDHDGIKWL